MGNTEGTEDSLRYRKAEVGFRAGHQTSYATATTTSYTGMTSAGVPMGKSMMGRSFDDDGSDSDESHVSVALPMSKSKLKKKSRSREGVKRIISGVTSTSGSSSGGGRDHQKHTSSTHTRLTDSSSRGGSGGRSQATTATDRPVFHARESATISKAAHSAPTKKKSGSGLKRKKKLFGRKDSGSDHHSGGHAGSSVRSSSGAHESSRTHTRSAEREDSMQSEFSALSPEDVARMQAAMPDESEMKPLDVFTGEAMHVCWIFWKDNIDILPRTRMKELALLLYSHMFQKMPLARRLFVKGEIESQALKFLDMLGWLIRRLKAPDKSNLIESLVSLGSRHSSWGVKIEYFQPFLESLHETLSDHFKHTYTVRVKFCMEQIFTVSANVMTGHDVTTVFATRYASSNHLRFLNSLEECLADPVGQEYLTRFLVQSFCGELVEFLNVYKMYRGALSDLERHYLATRVIQEFLTSSSKSELMITPELKTKVQKKLAAAHRKAPKGASVIHLPGDLFDPIYEWVITTIEDNPWPKFRKTLLTMASKLVSAHDGGLARSVVSDTDPI